jgi:WD40 repeat protein
MRPLLLLLPLCLFTPGLAAGEPKRPELVLPLGHSLSVSGAALSADGKRVLTGSYDTTAILWDVATGKSLQTFKGHTAQVHAVALSADGKRGVTGSNDRTAILWDGETGKALRVLRGHTDAVHAVVLSDNGQHILTGSDDRTAILWDADTGQPVRTFRGHEGVVGSVALSANGKRVLTGSWDFTSKLWDTDTAKALRTFKHKESVNSVALSADGKRAFLGANEQPAILWDTDTGKTLRTFKGIGPVAFSADGKRVRTAYTLWDAGTGKAVHVFKGPDLYDCMTFAADGKRAVIGATDGTATLWDVAASLPLQAFKGRASPITSLASGAGGKRVLTGAQDATAILWDTENIRALQTLRGQGTGGWSVSLSADGKRALTGSGDSTAVLWDADLALPLQTFRGHSQGILAVALSADVRRALTGSRDQTTILWDTGTAQRLQTFKGPKGHAPFSVVLATDGKIALTGGYDKTAIVWDTVTGRPRLTLRGHANLLGNTLFGLALSSDSKRAVTGASDRKAILWDVATGQPLQTFTGHANMIWSVALSSDGRRLLTGSADNTAILWDAVSGQALQTLRGHLGMVTGVAFGPGEAFFVTASYDGTVRFWKAGRDEPVFSMLSDGDNWLAWTPEGYYCCSPNGEDLIAWKVPADTPSGYRFVGPEQFRKQFYRPDLFRHLLDEKELAPALAAADKESKRPPAPPTTLAQVLPPVVLLTRPDRDSDVDGETVTVEGVAASVGDHAVSKMRLLVDGRPYLGNLSTWNVPEPKLGRAKRTWTVELEPGEHTVQVVAENAVGSEGRSDVVRLRRKAVVEKLPRLFVLAIGISEYDRPALRQGVYYCAADARKFADVIEKSSKPLYRDMQVQRLIDKDASRKKILQGLAQIRKQATQRDAILIFFAGHGKRDEQNDFYFMPVEVDSDDVSTTGLSEGDFKNAVKGIPGRVILLLDACHSGALIENDRRSGDGLTDRLYRDLTSNEYGLVMMCSSKGVEVSKESNAHKGGLFTVALVEGLSGKARKTSDGAVYLKALDDYVTDRVQVLSEGHQHPLTRQPTTISNIPLTRP